MVWLIGVFRATEHTRESAPSGLFQIFALVEKMQQRPLGGGGIVLGLATWGYRVILTIGSKITHLTPSRGFAAELAAATTVVIASGTGMPVSTTHTLVGAVLGVGLAKGISALNLGVVGRIVLSWVITLPVGAVLSIGFFFLFQAVFS